ncbi:S-adenosyl-L-methionine-dependent methyltransferase [Xylariomycetidae sp. FL2044]|nr:S-adenosyl-L-methionine-dependent methyltransferase [Xylariomycetidae sp. FL2044]
MPPQERGANSSIPPSWKWMRRREIADQYGSVHEGRRSYHGYMAGSYSLPNDGDEQARLDLQHIIWQIVLDGVLGLAPICGKSPAVVLDVATGTGAWAIDFAARNSESRVIGTDLSLIQPPTTPNVQFVVTDSEDEDWLFPVLFDYVHIRSSLVSFNNAQTVISKAYDQMGPGGWIEWQDSTWQLHSPDRSLEGTAIEKWSQLVLEGLKKNGRDTISGLQSMRTDLLRTGFVDVEDTVLRIPGSTWNRHESQKMEHMGMVAEAIIPLAIDSYRKILEYSTLPPNKIDALMDGAKADLQNPDIHFFFHVHCIFGRKP